MDAWRRVAQGMNYLIVPRWQREKNKPIPQRLITAENMNYTLNAKHTCKLKSDERQKIGCYLKSVCVNKGCLVIPLPPLLLVDSEHY